MLAEIFKIEELVKVTVAQNSTVRSYSYYLAVLTSPKVHMVNLIAETMTSPRLNETTVNLSYVNYGQLIYALFLFRLT